MFSSENFKELVKNGSKVARFVSFYGGNKVACIGPEVSIILNLFTEHYLDGVNLDIKKLSKIMAAWKDFQITKETETDRILMLHENSTKVLENVSLGVPGIECIPKVKDPCYLLLSWFESYRSMSGFCDPKERKPFMTGVNFYDNFDLMATDGKRLFAHRTGAEEGSNKYPQVIPYNAVLDNITPNQCWLTADGLWLTTDGFTYFVRKIDLVMSKMISYERVIPDYKTLSSSYFDCTFDSEFSKALKETQKFMKMDGVKGLLIDNEGLGYKALEVINLTEGPFIFKNKISVDVSTEEKFLLHINPAYLEALLKTTGLTGKEITLKINRENRAPVYWENDKDVCVLMPMQLS